jgi:16S rRNA (cytosine1402-N4)-methyltransferase
MVKEVLLYLNILPDGIYLDGTIGLGGHATQILSRLSTQGKLIGLDRDEGALNRCSSKLSVSSSPYSLHHASYDTFPQILQQQGIRGVNGMLLDLGLSSYQLSSPTRGFSYSSEGQLDMRFDERSSTTAAHILNRSSVTELTNLFKQYGEERYAQRIARRIKEMGTLQSVADLKEAIRRSTPPRGRPRIMARIFQALRIAVNRELDHLQTFLNQFIDYLLPQGRIVILSYHSLEDRMVKQTFKRLRQEGKFTILTPKPLRPGEIEIQKNPRAKSARFRAGEKIT